MAFNILDAVRAYFGNEMISKASNYLGETDSMLKKGLDTAIPASLAAIINKAQTGNPDTIMNLSKEAYHSGILNQLNDSFRVGGEGVPTIGPPMISSIFGDKFGALANAVSDFGGLKGSTSSSLFGTIIPLALAVLGKHSEENNLTPGGLASLLGSQKSSVLSSLPAGFNLSQVLGGDGSHVHSFASSSHGATTEKKKNSMFMPFVFGVVGLLLLLMLMRTCDQNPAETVTSPPAADTAVHH
jgi:hypothetical protein